MEQQLKEIAKELKMIRQEFELSNDLLLKDMGLDEQDGERTKPTRPNIADQLKEMFDNK